MILIAGGGIAGLAAAIALAPHSDVTVLERRGALASNDGAGIQLSPNAMKALAEIGAADAVRAVAHRPAGLRIRAGQRELTRVPYDRAFEARFGAPSLTAGRADLHGALLEVAQAHPAVTLRPGVAVSKVQREPHGWRLAGEDGPPATALVAADGVNSAVRSHLLGDRARDTGWVAWRGRAPAAADGAAQCDTTLTMLPGAHLVRYPIAERAAANVLYIAPARQARPGSRPGPFGEALAAVADWAPWPILVRPKHVFCAGGAAFVGDASHAMRPYLAQGAAMALEDAAVLSRCVAREGLCERAFAAYAELRASRVRRVADTSVRQGGLYHLAPPLSFGRDLAMRRLGAEGVLSRVAWLYGWSPEG